MERNKSQVNTEEIINKIRYKRNDISWIGINLDGTNAIVKIVKAKETPKLIDEKEYCNIVCKKGRNYSQNNSTKGNCQSKCWR